METIYIRDIEKRKEKFKENYDKVYKDTGLSDKKYRR